MASIAKYITRLGPRTSSSRLSPRRMAATSAVMIDSHVHVWACRDDASAFAQGLPPIDGEGETLVEEMAKAEVDMSIIVQPGYHGFDHAYMIGIINQFPSKFRGILLANPGKEGVEQLQALVRNHGFVGVRFNPALWPSGEPMSNAAGKALFHEAGRLGVPVGFMTMKGLLEHADEIEALMEDSPETPVILDHFGFCPADRPDDPSWERLLAMSKYPQVHVKVSAFFRITDEQYPYLCSRPKVRALVDAFGADRLMWGSDWPWVSKKCGYAKAWGILQAGDQAQGEDLLTEEEKRLIMGGTAARLFRVDEKRCL